MGVRRRRRSRGCGATLETDWALGAFPTPPFNMVFGTRRRSSSTDEHALPPTERRVARPPRRLQCVPAWPPQYPPVSVTRQQLCAAHRVFSGDRSSVVGSAYAVVTLISVLLAVTSTCVASLQTFRTPDGGYTSNVFFYIDCTVAILFASEWVTRLFTALAMPDAEEMRWWAARAAESSAGAPPLPAPATYRITPVVAARRLLRFSLQFTALLDLAAWLPSAIAILISTTSSPNQQSIAGLNVLRLTRVLYLVKLTRMSPVLLLLQATMKVRLHCRASHHEPRHLPCRLSPSPLVGITRRVGHATHLRRRLRHRAELRRLRRGAGHVRPGGAAGSRVVPTNCAGGRGGAHVLHVRPAR